MYCKLILITFLLLSLWGCTSHENSKKLKHTVAINIRHASGSHIYLEKRPERYMDTEILDSASISSNNEELKLSFFASEESVYIIRIIGAFDYTFEFVNDIKEIGIEADVLFKDNLRFTNSPANQEYATFIKTRIAESEKIKKITDSLTKTSKGENKNETISVIDSFQRATYTKLRNYANKIQSPSNYLRIFPSLEFFNDTSLLIESISIAKNKFPTHSQIISLYDKVQNHLDIFRKEFYIGDTLPIFSLPDRSNKIISIDNFRTKYVLLDFWSSLNPDNGIHDLQLKSLYEKTKGKNFVIISVAIEQGKEFWYNNIKTINAPWPQLIDSLGWEGVAIRTTKIDSIPFNFLLDPNGVITEKAIPTDSIISIILKKIN